MSKRKPVEYIENENGCFICVSHYCDKDGYPEMRWEGKAQKISRIVYKEFIGEIPEDCVIRHSCDNPSCINPEHLSIGTHFDNVQDKVNRNRQAKGETNGRVKLTEEDVIFIRNSDLGPTEIALMFNVTRRVIYSIRNNITWKHVA